MRVVCVGVWRGRTGGRVGGLEGKGRRERKTQGSPVEAVFYFLSLGSSAERRWELTGPARKAGHHAGRGHKKGKERTGVS